MDPEPYRRCRLCPRECGVDRFAGRTGRCGETSALRVASIGPHFGEEPSFTGTRGSGTVFFTGCSSGCFFCQNWQISVEELGGEMSSDELFVRVLSMVRGGVHNVNLVTPDHVWPHVEDLCVRLRETGVTVPFLFNGSGYQRTGMIPAYLRHIDIFLPDFKFADGRLAGRCMGDARYPDLALMAIRAMVGALGFLEPWDPTGARTAERGVLVRHLVLPGEVQNSLDILRLLRREFGRHLPLSVMSQFRPNPACLERLDLARGVTHEEYGEVLACVAELGFDQVYLQELRDDDAFSPDFRRERPFHGNRSDPPPSPS
jgi:putative pyruvate formate lyase activating enzyme